MIYPKKLISNKGQIVLKILLIVSILISILLIIINKLTKTDIHWAAIVNCGIIHIWITVIYSIKRGTNIAGHILLQLIAISLAMIYIDYIIGFIGWSTNIAIPILLIIANITMLILTLVSYKKYIKYAIYQLVIVIMSLISIFFITNNLIEMKLLNTIAMIISVLNLIITLILCYKDIRDAIIRKIHM